MCGVTQVRGVPARPGTQHSCVVCKTSEHHSWTYTLTQELNVP